MMSSEQNIWNHKDINNQVLNDIEGILRAIEIALDSE
jgi:hypothetical protein